MPYYYYYCYYYYTTANNNSTSKQPVWYKIDDIQKLTWMMEVQVGTVIQSGFFFWFQVDLWDPRHGGSIEGLTGGLEDDSARLALCVGPLLGSVGMSAAFSLVLFCGCIGDHQCLENSAWMFIWLYQLPAILNKCALSHFKVGQPWITNLRVMWTNGWVMSKCTQDSHLVPQLK